MNKPVAIVMIEDDHGHARLIERNIRRAGVTNEIIHFSDGASAFAYFKRIESEPADLNPILVLLDLNLPDMSGIDILEYLKNDGHLRVAPVIVLTTTDDQLEIRRCYDLGCNVYITKPVDYEQFAVAIRQLGLFFSVIKVPDPLNA
ncbi:response regulator receiver protein [Rhodomicrobium vannielii ATCC 17100]|uniref:Response regulator receiver protein n=1 Tax=Rhodomicrobium vannielii (strain ATCC 17100 / DSM 162 / LMG 4299 / NCIMB 10020 / ATH 3.1.1) TaxID=648757 RepID=E3I661_RHOVT|nr:response regulator [Rhodomicrobium vannielii]ADP71726.1 response regulator receiver protein [Rhodomicrobium vannielii ATCC 17100]